MSTRVPEFTRPTPAAPEAKPEPTGRLASLLSKVTDLVKSDRINKQSSFQELVTQIVACELDPKAKLPNPETTQAIVAAAGKTFDDLTDVVARKVKIAQLATGLTGENQAREDLVEARQKLKQHKIDFEAAIVRMQAEGDQLEAEERSLQKRVQNFESMRRELESLAGGPSLDEVEIQAKIRLLTDEEMRVRSQAGHGLLADRYIDGNLEDSEVFKTYTALTEAVKTTEEEINQGNGSGMTRADFRLRKQASKLSDCERALAREKQLYRLGSQVRQIKQERAELSAKCEQFRRDRQAKLLA